MPTQSRDDRFQAFIDAATVKHDGRYDYEQVPAKFVNAHTKVTIGCPDCFGRRNSKATVRGARFEAQAAAMHGDRYDYSAVKFVDQHTEVTILCRTHGPFTQRPTNHLDTDSPSGCPDCANQSRRAAPKDARTRRTPTQRRNAGTGEYVAA